MSTTIKTPMKATLSRSKISDGSRQAIPESKVVKKRIRQAPCWSTKLPIARAKATLTATLMLLTKLLTAGLETYSWTMKDRATL